MKKYLLAMEIFIKLFIFLIISTVLVKSEIESSNTALKTNYPLRKESKINLLYNV